MKTKSNALQIGKVYSLRAYGNAKYLGMVETNSGLMWEFLAQENTPWTWKSKPFRIPYDATGLEI